MKARFVLCAGIAAISLKGQDSTIRATVPLVSLPTSVTERDGTVISGLKGSDFTLLDNGKKKSVSIDTVESGLAPVALVVVVQTSDVSSPALGKIRKISSLVSQMVAGENGEVAVVSFGDQVTVVQDFTRDSNEVDSAFARLKEAGNTRGRMLDAVDRSLAMLSRRPGSRRSNILIMGESRDRGSETKLEDLWGRLQGQGITVYALKYSAYWTAFTTKPDDYRPTGGGLLDGIGGLARLSKENTTDALTRITGGTSASFQTKAKLENNLMLLSKDIHNRYLVSFIPDAASTPSFHQVSIQIRNHPNAVVRTRPGYWASF